MATAGRSGGGQSSAHGACDACRMRKIKCDLVDGQPRCRPCERADVPCGFTYKRKRPGPQPGYIARLPNPEAGPSTLPPRTPMEHRPSSESGPPTGNVFPPSDRGEDILSVILDAHSSGGPFESVISRPLLSIFLDMYFDYIFCLVPFPRQAVFMADYYNRRDLHPEADEWVAMVLAMAAFTISLVPHQLLSMSKHDLRLTAERCLQRARAYLLMPSGEATNERFFIIYCVGFVCHNLGQSLASREFHGMNVSAALSVDMDKELSYMPGVDADPDMRRRLWWLIYTGDRSAALSEGGRMLIGDEELIQVQDPPMQNRQTFGLGSDLVSLDDSPSIEDGFAYNIRIWRLAGQLLIRRDQDYRNPPTGAALRVREAELATILDQLEHVLDGCPPHLQMDKTGLPSPFATFDFPEHLDVPSYEEGSLMVKNDPRLAFVIQQANIYITRQCVIFMGIQHQEFLFQARGGEAAIVQKPFELAKQKVMADLLRILRTLPLELIAVNALPGVSKIRYVAASLLTELSDANSTDDVAVARAQQSLVQYLDLLSRIEELYSLTDA